MCSSGSCDLEDIPLEDDDPDSIEFKILAYYTRHHVFKSSPEAFSPQRQGAASQPQKGRGTQVSPPFIYSSSSEKNVNLGKKKSSWRTFFGATQKEDDLLSWPGLIRAQGGTARAVFQGGSQGEQWFQHLESAGRPGELLVSSPTPSLLCTLHASPLPLPHSQAASGPPMPALPVQSPVITACFSPTTQKGRR
jgi:hypothetical protein